MTTTDGTDGIRCFASLRHGTAGRFPDGPRV